MSDDLVPPAEFRILLALVDGPKHGHAIRQEVLDRTDGRVDLGPGTLYGAIKRLARRGWIGEVEAPVGEEGDGRRRFYRITSRGRDAARDRSIGDQAPDRSVCRSSRGAGWDPAAHARRSRRWR